MTPIIIKELNENADSPTCIAWLEELGKSDRRYHIDDSPKEIIWVGHGEPLPGQVKGERIFTDDECELLTWNLAVCERRLGWDWTWSVYYAAVQSAEHADEDPQRSSRS